MNATYLIKKLKGIPVEKQVILILGATDIEINENNIDRLFYRIKEGVPYDIDYKTIINKAKYIRAVMKAYNGDFSQIDLI